MSTTLAVTIKAELAGEFRKTSDFNDKDLIQTLALALDSVFTDGTGAGQANKVMQLVLEDNLGGPVVVQAFNQNLGAPAADSAASAMTAVKAILIVNDSADESITIIPESGSEFLGPLAHASDSIVIPPGGVFLITNPTAAGWAVTASIADSWNISSPTTLNGRLFYIGI